MFTTESAILFIIVTTLAVSYGWGMRGTLCGGEQGALLPGAFLGFCVALFSPSTVIDQNIALFTSIGACGMFCGGDMTYGETLSFCLYRGEEKPPAYKKGMIAVFIKGGLWFSVAAGFLGIGTGVLRGTYSWQSILVLMLTMPIIMLIGKWFFNMPINAKENKFPAIYFSKTREESWGANLLMLVEMLVFMLVFNDTYSIKMALFGFIGGSFGWMTALSGFSLTSKTFKNGKHFFGKLNENGFIGGWKLMECVLGAVGGLAIAIGAVVCSGDIKDLTVQAPTIAEQKPELFGILIWVMIAGLLIDQSQHLFRKRPSKSYKEDLENGLISQKEADRCKALLKNEKYGAALEKYSMFYDELSERPFYFYIPMILCLLGSVQAANIISVFMLFIVAAERLVADRFTNVRNTKITLGIFWAIVSLAILIVGMFVLPDGYSPLAIWLFLCIEYEFFQLTNNFRPSAVVRRIKKIGSFQKYFRSLGSMLTMHIYYFIVLAFLIYTGFILI